MPVNREGIPKIKKNSKNKNKNKKNNLERGTQKQER
jgi:hypothetical protein